MVFIKKSQSAMEFLMTYGWAMLTVLVVIAALVWFGLLDPSTFLGDKCVAPLGFTCLDSTAYTDGVTLLIRNEQFDNAKSISIGVENCGYGIKGQKYGYQLPQGESDIYHIVCDLSDVKRVKGDLIISFIAKDNISKSLRGDLRTQVSDEPGAARIICNTADDLGSSVCNQLDDLFWSGFKQSCCDNYNKCC